MKIGILGGGQLGRMFLQEAANYPHSVAILDPTLDAPAAALTDDFYCGDFNDEATVLAFGEEQDVIGIEIEHVSVAALKQLREAGKRVIPEPRVLEMIQDKGKQKQFYADHKLATTDFYLIKGRDEVDLEKIALPFVQKLRTGGYDGRGVQVIRDEQELDNLWDEPSVIEAMCPIAKEIAVLVATDGSGDLVCYPILEMVFNPELNLVDVVKTPARLSSSVEAHAVALAEDAVLAMASAGIFAVELFVDQEGEVLINEIAPRVHNSAHLTIEACPSSQFDQMWRILAKQPLGTVQLYRPAAMVNLIGAEGHEGEAVLPHLEKLLALDEVSVHWYGKSVTRPGRKMGHVTILAASDEALNRKIDKVKQYAEVIARG
ncbi:5-(carboxyamino)imidazole ribonucleotide synthase [Suttonella sp. R2A3]|uniref:5-(carboxyamino)imidazole ribonucleotide synthase n=1 Tax=Suttonella sp. R2A3 TaxID=2908648 RepID=UPI001F40BA87|nr:5-(carboxyamino)imidazole ribonucleotide synthase [Suttonella sp. R2A3]UJF24747.1 5-(carboxyamino)imidazole ribonucleotide synthase [Suttonella sp. R2A3]